MICPSCQGTKNYVTDNRKSDVKIWRRHRCAQCRTSWHSIEISRPLMQAITGHLPPTSQFLDLIEEMKNPSMERNLKKRQAENQKHKHNRNRRERKTPPVPVKEKKVDWDWYRNDKALKENASHD